MTRARNYFAWQSRLVVRELGQRVLEVGCGIGNFTGLLLDRELGGGSRSRGGLRRGTPAALSFRACFGVRSGWATRFVNWPDGSLIRCVCVNVLEHVPDDGAAMRDMAWGGWRRAGVVVLLVPAFNAPLRSDRSQSGALPPLSPRRDRATGGSGRGWKSPKLHYVNSVGFFGWWVNAHLLKREAQSDGPDRGVRSVPGARDGSGGGGGKAALRSVDPGRVAETVGMRIALIIPCFNEERTIAKVIRDFRTELPDAAIYVGDNNSTDATARIAEAAGATVIPVYPPGQRGR